MDTKIVVSRNVTISTSSIPESGFDASLVGVDQHGEWRYPCDLSQGDLLLQIRPMLLKDLSLQQLINKAEELFTDKGNEALFYYIVEDEISNFELNGEKTSDKITFNRINSRNKRFLSWLEDRLKASSIYGNGVNSGRYISGVTLKAEVVEVEKKSRKQQKKSVVWLKGEDHFNRVLEYLKKPNLNYQRAWILEENNKFKWLGTIAQARAFITVCRDNSFIKPDTSAKSAIIFMNETFQVEASIKSVSEWSRNSPTNPIDVRAFFDIPKR